MAKILTPNLVLKFWSPSVTSCISRFSCMYLVFLSSNNFTWPRRSLNSSAIQTIQRWFHSKNMKQVAQRATIAHLSPMCQGQSAPKPYAAFRDIQVQKCEIFVTQGQLTPKWFVWFGPKSNSTELLCLSWLPATLMMIQSKMNKLAWRHYFSIISLWEIF